MKIGLSQADRAGLATIFLRPQSRGGTAEVLLMQDDLHTLFGIDDFDTGQGTVELSKLSKVENEYEVPDSHLEVLRQMLGWPGQSHTAARIIARVLRKIQPPPAPAAAAATSNGVDEATPEPVRQ